MELLGNNDGRNFCSNLNHNVAQDSLEELVARAQDLAQRWQDAIDDCTSFNLAAVEAASDIWDEEQKRAAAVDLLDPVDDEADLGFSFDAPIAA